MNRSSTSPHELVTEVFGRKQGVVFCGAGISVDAPSSLPSWNSLRDKTLEAVASRDSHLHQYLDHLTKCSAFRGADKWGLSPELVASHLSKFGNGYFESFRALESGEPNENHRHLAKLAKAGFLKFIITTNFDLFIERAFDEEAVQYYTYRSTEEFRTFEKNNSGVHLLKLHGCISTPASIIATVEQEGQGLTAEKCKALETLLCSYTFVFWGYSGQDMKIDIDYLRMMSVADRAKGFVWSFHKSGNAANAPNTYVLQLQKAYGERGQIGYGLLPKATQPLLPADRSDDTARRSPSEDRKLAESKDSALREALFDWAAEHLSPIEACYTFAQLLYEAGRLEDSMACQEYVLGLATDANDMLWQRTSNLRQSDVHQEFGNLAEAYRCAGEARRIAESIGEKWVLSLPLERLAEIHVLWGQYEEALACLDVAENSLEKTFHLGRSQILSQKARIQGCQGRSEEALRLYKESVEILTDHGDKLGLAIIWNDIGHIYFDWGEYDQALDYYKKSEEIDIAHNRKVGIAFSQYNIATVHIARDEYQQASACLELARRIASEVGNKGLLATIISSQAAISLKEERYDDALGEYQHVAEVFRSTGDRKNLGSVLANIASVHNSRSEYSLAVERYSEALGELERIGANFLSASICGFLGSVLAESLDNPKDALRYFQRSLMYYRRAESLGDIPVAIQQLVHCKSKVLGLSEIPFDSLLTECSLGHPVLEIALKRIATALKLDVVPFNFKGFCARLTTAHSRKDVEPIVLQHLAELAQRSRSEGDLPFSAKVFKATCCISIAVGDLHLASLMANESGLVLYEAGEHLEAAKAFEEGEKTSRILGDEYELVTRLNNRARVYLDTQDTTSAAEILCMAEKHARRLPSSDQLVRVLSNLSECYRKRGETANSIVYYEELRSIASQNGDFDTVIKSLMGIGKCYRDDGQYRRSVEYRKRALVVAELTKLYNTAGPLCALIANTYYRELEERDAALFYYRKAIAYFQNAGDAETAGQLAQMLKACELGIS
ncbi:MAG: hypothetical protein C4523_15715 [Myxococcales bacterium]|nr:MAG: hypothetical protein C4523_15715 [Myxococcales bacterium]